MVTYRRAAASMLIVAPVEQTKLATAGEILLFSSQHFIVIGNVAAEELVPKAKRNAGVMLYKYLYGFLLVVKKFG